MADLTDFKNFITLPFFTGITIVPILAILFMYIRTGSGHVFLEWIWSFVSKGKTITDEKIIAFGQEVSNIDKFRFMTGLDVRKTSDIHKVTKWIKTYNLSQKDVIFANRWINVGSNELIKKPPKTYALWLFFLTLVCGYFFLISIPLINKNAMIITINKTGNSYIIKDDYYQSFFYLNVFGKTVADNFNKCNSVVNDGVAQLSITQTEKEYREDLGVICEFSKQKDFLTIVKDNITFQKGFGIILLCFDIFGFIFVFVAFRAAESALNILRDINKTNPTS
jgi:hypothetical protein